MRSQKKVGPYWKTINYIVRIWTGGNFSDKERLCKTYRDHYAHIRAVVRKDRLLEFNPQDGYESLCKFLGEPLPNESSYPHINRPDNIITMHTKLWWFTLANAVLKIGTGIGAVGVAAGAVWYYRYMR